MSSKIIYPYMKHCEYCSKEFQCPNPYNGKEQRFCSRSCSTTHHYKTRTPEQLQEISDRQKKSAINYHKNNQSIPIFSKTSNNKTIPTYKAIKKYIFNEQNKCCNKCGLDTWLGLPITLELEHKDGNTRNNLRENLELLCPNCHSQTPTWKGRNRKKTNTKAIPINGYSSIRQYLISEGKCGKGNMHYKVKEKMACPAGFEPT